MEATDYRPLKQQQRAERDGCNPNLALCVHRPLSWLNPGAVIV